MVGDDLDHRGLGFPLEQCGVHRFAFGIGEHQCDELVGPRQIAGMSGQDAVGILLHGGLPIGSGSVGITS